MIKNLVNTFISSLVLCLLTFPVSLQAEDEFNFSEFKTSATYLEPLTSIDYTSHSSADALKERLDRLLGVKANYAGKYHVLLSGCGTMCQAVVVIDVQSGDIADIDTASTGACFQMDSRLLILNPYLSSDFDDEIPEWAFSYYYEITDNGLALLSKTKNSFTGECQYGQ